MEEKRSKELIWLAVEIGEAMLENGAEIYRVEDTIKHIVNSCKVKDCNIYVLSNGIFVSAQEESKDGISLVRHVPERAVHLKRIAALNELSRTFCRGEYSIEEAKVRLEEARALPSYSEKKQLIACGAGCAGFAYLCGGQLLDCVITVFIGAVIRFIILYGGKHKHTNLAINFIGSFFTMALAIILVEIGVPLHPDKVVSGGIMALVPGTMFTTSVRDFLNGDYLSGVIHMADAVLTSIEIAAGVGAMLALYQVLTGRCFLVI